MYLRSKGDGERIVRASGLDWTIFRPSVVFGPDDHFLNLFAQMQQMAPVVPLACAQARFQPVFVQDVVQAFLNAMVNPATIGRGYELGGPQVYTLEELVRFAGRASGHPRPVIALPDAPARGVVDDQTKSIQGSGHAYGQHPHGQDPSITPA